VAVGVGCAVLAPYAVCVGLGGRVGDAAGEVRAWWGAGVPLRRAEGVALDDGCADANTVTVGCGPGAAPAGTAGGSTMGACPPGCEPSASAVTVAAGAAEGAGAPVAGASGADGVAAAPEELTLQLDTAR
jgi:hypothetical protein